MSGINIWGPDAIFLEILSVLSIVGWCLIAMRHPRATCSFVCRDSCCCFLCSKTNFPNPTSSSSSYLSPLFPLVLSQYLWKSVSHSEFVTWPCLWITVCSFLHYTSRNILVHQGYNPTYLEKLRQEDHKLNLPPYRTSSSPARPI